MRWGEVEAENGGGGGGGGSGEKGEREFILFVREISQWEGLFGRELLWGYSVMMVMVVCGGSSSSSSGGGGADGGGSGGRRLFARGNPFMQISTRMFF
ncbi:hypothetical protein M0804_015339 [Polistes exclamans]|nr:hypothetical protein M0804_015369 [Polistes exclamans]KAI4473455.1 hypothetical protein M0804_015339 [Polistes exclamans]